MVVCDWRGPEQKKLLAGLRALNKTDGDPADLDYDILKKSVPSRSTTEIESVIDALKDKIISSVCLKLENQKREEKKDRKPIEMWTDMASVVGGAVEEPITTAFSQMLIVSSTEPCTLKNSDPPRFHEQPADQNGPVGRIVPLRPIHDTPVHAPTSPATRLPAPSQGATNTTPPATGNGIAACQSCGRAFPSTPGPTQTTTVHSAAAATPVLSTSDRGRPLLPHAASSSGPAHTTPSSSAAACPPKSGPTSNDTREQCPCYPGALGVRSIVNFEKIYQYLGVINNPGQGCRLTAMESAIVLDLLMSLPEELPLLDCKSLRQHLIQVYKILSVPADFKIIQELFKNLKETAEPGLQSAGSRDGPGGQRPRHPETNPQQDDHSYGTKDTGPKAPRPQETDNRSPGNTDTHSRCEDEDTAGLCPPLNPFMVPPALLKRKPKAK